MKSKIFKKRAVIVSVRKEHTHTRPLVPLSGTAAAGTVTTGSSDFGSVSTPLTVSPKESQLSQPELLLSLRSAFEGELQLGAMADSSTWGRLTQSPLGFLSLKLFAYQTSVVPPQPHLLTLLSLRGHVVSTLGQLALSKTQKLF